MSILLSSLIAGLLTGVGSLISIHINKPNSKIVGGSLGFAAGIMIGISFFYLLPSSLSTDTTFYPMIGLVIGFLFMLGIEFVIPHHKETMSQENKYLKMGYFIALGIAVHNFPEGLAIGASYIVSEKTGFLMAVLIGLHNIVEGVAVSLPLHLGNLNKIKTIIITTLTGVSTLLGTAVGLYLVNISANFISLSTAFAAGAMIYISFFELIPNSRKENRLIANIFLLVGLIISILL